MGILSNMDIMIRASSSPLNQVSNTHPTPSSVVRMITFCDILPATNIFDDSASHHNPNANYKMHEHVRFYTDKLVLHTDN